MDTVSGMNAQAEAFSHFLNLCVEGLDDGRLITKRPYFNCRERGFVITVWGRKSQTAKHFAWFEHRNSDGLCCIAWEGKTSGAHGDFFTVADIPTKAYPDKWSVTKSFSWGDFGNAAVWLRQEIDAYPSRVVAA